MTIVPLIVGYFAIQWNRANFLGKSPEQIVAMGRERWSNLYETKVGSSTVNICEAESKYGEALSNLNNRAIQRLPSGRQQWLTSVRVLALQYAQSAHMVGRIVTGGGTIWQTFDASITPDIEELVSESILKRKADGVPVKSLYQANVELDNRLQTMELSSEDRATLLTHREQMRRREQDLLQVLAKGDQSDQIRYKAYLHHNITIASGSGL